MYQMHVYKLLKSQSYTDNIEEKAYPFLRLQLLLHEILDICFWFLKDIQYNQLIHNVHLLKISQQEHKCQSKRSDINKQQKKKTSTNSDHEWG